MNNIQKEDGYTSIPNEILEAFACYRISGEQWQCLILIIRNTYDYQRKECIIKNKDFVSISGMLRQNVNRTLNELIRKKIIYFRLDDNGNKIYKINKNYDQWIK